MRYSPISILTGIYKKFTGNYTEEKKDYENHLNAVRNDREPPLLPLDKNISLDNLTGVRQGL